MITTDIESEFRRKVCGEIDIELEGLNRFIVYTPFMFDDGDHFVIVLKRNESRWLLTDEGHTFMHLSYAGFDLERGTRRSIIDQALMSFNLTNMQGELRLEVPDQQFGDALFSFVQALTKVSDTGYWTRERVQSTFLEDFQNLLREEIPPERRTFDYFDRQHDPDGIYPVDCKVNGMAKPLFVFGVNNDSKCRDATITILQFEKWGNSFQSMAIFEDQTQINSKVLARFSDVAGKLFSSLGARDRVTSYLRDVLQTNRAS